MSEPFKLQYHATGRAGTKNFQAVVELLKQTIAQNKLGIEVTEVNHEKFEAQESIIAKMEEALKNIQHVYEEPGFKTTPLVFHALAQVGLTALKEYKEKNK